MSFTARLQRAREVLEQELRLSGRALGRELGISGDELLEIIEDLVDIQRAAWRRRQGCSSGWVPRHSTSVRPLKRMLRAINSFGICSPSGWTSRWLLATNCYYKTNV